MRLKRLTLWGFKSFPDRTHFDFQPGITGIVGPNGCGKSNLVDAIKWVLGDQSPRSLRGRQMADMIFNGSATRKASNVAQIDLWLTDCQDALGVDRPDIVISRRLYRTGESEYLINHQPVRLRDIRELFMDTGIGVRAYSIIEQGQVDQFLRASSLERREIFDEAAGISKYKARKREALRKLERATANLQRVEDILNEVERRLRSVRAQATRARNWQQYTHRLRELRATFSLAEYHRLTETLAAVQGEQDEVQAQLAALRSAISQGEARSSEIDARLLDLDREIAAAEGRLLATQSRISGLEERIRQSRQRIEEQRDVLEAAQRRLEQSQSEIASRRSEVQRDEADYAALERRRCELDEALGRCLSEDQALALAETQATTECETARDRMFATVQQISRIEQRLEALAGEQAAIDASLGALVARAAEISQRRSELASRHAAHQADLTRIDAEVARVRDDIEAARRRLAELESRRSALSEDLAAARERRSALASRRETLADLEARREGVARAAARLLEARDESAGQRFGYVLGLVADLLEADPPFAPLVDAVLGERAQHVVVGDGQALEADLAALRRLGGRVTFVRLDRLPPHFEAPDISSLDGVVARLADAVRASEEARPLVRWLFGRTYVVESLEVGLRLAAELPPRYRFVSRTGEIVESDGTVSLAPACAGGAEQPAEGVDAEPAPAGLVSRRAALRQLDERLAETDARIEALLSARTEVGTNVSQAERELEALREQAHALSTRRVEHSGQLERLADDLASLDREAERIAADRQAAEQRRARLAEERASLEADLGRHRTEAEDLRRRIADVEANLETLTERRRSVGERLTALRVEAGQVSEKASAAQARLRETRQALHTLEQAAARHAEELDQCRQRIAHAEEAVLEAEAELQRLGGERQVLLREIHDLRNQREGLRGEVEALSERLRADRSEADLVESHLHELQMRCQEARLRRDELADRVREELEVDLARLYADYQAEPQRDWDAVRAEIEDLRQRIDRLGHVNLEAIAEQAELEQRYEFLRTQHDDLVGAKRRLESLIERLNRESLERFVRTFETTRGHFQELFRKLFGGGRANLFLENPDDPLESGIEITAQPPGKELQSISLMSGGEKSLTCIALLLALFRSRPSPFAILDEVDAALDEANNERFNQIIREFLDQSQFIIVTHNKRTMAMTDALYGVTMQEPGVSRRVSVRFEEVGADGRLSESALRRAEEPAVA